VYKKQVIYWLSVALQIHYEPEIVEAFKIAIDELTKQTYREKLDTSYMIVKSLPQIIFAQPNQEIQQPKTLMQG